MDIKNNASSKHSDIDPPTSSVDSHYSSGSISEKIGKKIKDKSEKKDKDKKEKRDKKKKKIKSGTDSFSKSFVFFKKSSTRDLTPNTYNTGTSFVSMI